MAKRKKITSVFLIILGNLSVTISAFTLNLPSFEMSFYQSYDNNLLKTVEPIPDFMTSLYMSSVYLINPDVLIAYKANLNYLRQYPELNYQIHAILLDFQRALFDGRNILSIKNEFGLRHNDKEYQQFDQQYFKSDLATKYLIGQTTFTRFSYKLLYENWNKNKNYNSLDNLWSIHLGSSFSSRTSIQMGFEVGYRDFTKLDSEKGLRLAYLIKIAQSLAEMTGLQFQYYRNLSLRSDHSILQLYDIGSFPDDDDKYSYSGSLFQLSLKHYVMPDFNFKVSFAIEDRRYDLQEPLFKASSHRDMIAFFILEVHKQLPINLSFLDRSAIDAQSAFIKNSSSESNFGFSNMLISIGISFSL